MNQVLQLLNKLEVTNPEDVIEKISKFQEYLLKVNKQINLVSRKNSDEVIYNLTMDSLSVLEFIEYDSGCTLLDIGSGNGFPGIIHKIVNPSIKLISIDSNQRKIQFQKEAVKLVELDNCQFFAERAERIKPLNGDFIISKAVGGFEFLINLAKLQLRKNGLLVIPCSERAECPIIDDNEFILDNELIYSYQTNKDNKKSCKLLVFKNI